MISYLILLGLFMGIYSLLGLGLNVQWGYAGLLNFGYGAVMMVDTYTTGLLTLRRVPWPIAPLVAIAGAGVMTDREVCCTGVG